MSRVKLKTTSVPCHKTHKPYHCRKTALQQMVQRNQTQGRIQQPAAEDDLIEAAYDMFTTGMTRYLSTTRSQRYPLSGSVIQSLWRSALRLCRITSIPHCCKRPCGQATEMAVNRPRAGGPDLTPGRQGEHPADPAVCPQWHRPLHATLQGKWRTLSYGQ